MKAEHSVDEMNDLTYRFEILPYLVLRPTSTVYWCGRGCFLRDTEENLSVLFQVSPSIFPDSQLP